MKKQKSGLYRTAVTVNGAKVWLSAKTKAQLQQKKRETKQRLLYGTPTEDMTFHDLVRRWWTDIKQPSGIRAGTADNIRSLINKWILPQIDQRQSARAVRRADLQAVITHMRDQVTPYRTLYVKNILSQVCQYGMELGCMTADYAHNISTPKLEANHRQSIPLEDVKAMFDNCLPEDLPTLAVLYYTGLRRGEAVALTWADVDFKSNSISVAKSLDSHDHSIGKTKTAAGVRVVPMVDELRAILYPLRGAPAGHVLGYGSTHTFINRWTRIQAYAGLTKKKYVPHQMRHTFATILHSAGVDPVTASRMMGHASYKVTADIYTDIDNRTANHAKESLQQAFAQDLKQHVENG